MVGFRTRAEEGPGNPREAGGFGMALPSALKSRPARRLLHYAGAVAYVALAVLLRWLLTPWLDDQLPFSTLFLAVVFTTWLSGRGPALLALTAGAVLADYFLLSPRYTFAVNRREYQIGFFLYVSAGLAAIFLFDSLRQAWQRAEEKQRQLEQEIQSRRAAEQEVLSLNRDLHRRVTEFQALLEVIPIGIAVADDPHCRHIWTNPAMSRLLGLPARANVSLSAPADERPPFKVFEGGRELAAHELPMQAAVATGQPVSGVKQELQLADGTWLSLLQYAVPLRDEQGNIRGGLYAGVDVTAQERIQRALRDAEQRWRTMTETMPNLVWTTLPDGACDWLSSQWRGYTGLAEEELRGAGWLEKVVHPDDRERTLAAWKEACADESAYDMEYRLRRHDGEYRWFKTRGVPLRDEQGRCLSWIGACTDIHDRKRAEQELRAADRRKDEFLATLAHELRNPLAPLRNGLQLMRAASDDRAAVEKVRGMMDRQLAQLVRLVDDLLDMSRITQGKIQLRRAPAPLTAVIQSAVETSRPLIEQMGHQLTVSLPEQPVILDADLTRLAQVFLNLLNNAAKYTEPGGHIRLHAEQQGSDVVVSVRDNGIGLSAEQLPHLFEMFQQSERALERAQGAWASA